MKERRGRGKVQVHVKDIIERRRRGKVKVHVKDMKERRRRGKVKVQVKDMIERRRSGKVKVQVKDMIERRMSRMKEKCIDRNNLLGVTNRFQVSSVSRFLDLYSGERKGNKNSQCRFQ